MDVRIENFEADLQRDRFSFNIFSLNPLEKILIDFLPR